MLLNNWWSYKSHVDSNSKAIGESIFLDTTGIRGDIWQARPKLSNRHSPGCSGHNGVLVMKSSDLEAVPGLDPTTVLGHLRC
jgi:hypothetical protein